MIEQRFIGLDIHKRHVMVTGVNQHQEIILPPRKVSIQHFASWIQTHLKPTDVVALEATSNAWKIHDRLQPAVASVSVANTRQLKLISSSAKKTDKHDALVIAKLLAAQLLPGIWVPPQHVRDLRQLTQHRSQLLTQRTAMKNKLHAILHQHNLQLPDGDPFSKANEVWWAQLPICEIECLLAKQYWLNLNHISQLIAETESQIAQTSIHSDWDEAMTLLMQMPGIGLYTGMTILAAIGDIARFPSARQLVGYAGLGARIRASGNTVRSGSISKQGRRELRSSPVPGQLFDIPTTSALSFSHCHGVLANTRLLRPLHANCLPLSGTSSPNVNPIAMPIPKLSRALS